MDAYTQPPAAPAAPPPANPLGLSLANMLAGGGKFTNPAYATPAQRAELYKYANAMLAPQTVKNGWQGLAEMARALIGGYASNKADLWEQAASLQGKTDIANGPIGKITAPGTSAAIPPAYNVAPAEPHSAPSGGASSASITGDTLSDLKNGIANNVETPGYSQKDSYLAVGPETRGDRPYGRYQVMGSNVGPWTKEVIGHALTPEQFLHDQGAQEAVASGKLSQLLSQYGNPKDAASVWLTGRPLSTGANAKDINGMSGQRYADLATQGMGASAAPAGVSPPIGPNGLAVPLPDSATMPGGNYPAVVANDAKEGDAWLAAHGGAPSAYAPSPAPAGASPAAAAIGTPGPGLPALAQPARPMTMAQNASGGLPVSAGAIGEFLGNPNIDPEVKRLGMELIQPKPVTDVAGNTSISRQLMPPDQSGTPWARQGFKIPDSNVGGVGFGGFGFPNAGGTPSITTVGPFGVTDNPSAPPSAPGPAPHSGGAPPAPSSVGERIFGPNSPVGSIVKSQQEAAGRGEAIGKVAGGSGESYVGDMRAATNFQRAKLPLERAIPALERLGSTGTGPGSETWNHYMSFLQTIGVRGVDTSKIKDYDEANKYLTDFVNQNGDHGTNDRLAAAFAGSPSVHISNAAAVDVAKTALAMQRFKQAQVMGFSGEPDPQTGQPMTPDKYLQYATTYQKTHDPRAYGVDMMSPTAKEALKRELKADPAAAAKFKQSYDEAVSLGLVPAR